MSFKETDFLGKLFPNIWIIFHISCLKRKNRLNCSHFEHLKGKLGIFVASLNKIRLK